MLTSYATPKRSASPNFLEGQVAFSHPRLSNNRSVMPLDVQGCTHATLTGSACAYPSPADAGNPLNPIRDGDWGLQLFPMNEEFPIGFISPLSGAPVPNISMFHTHGFSDQRPHQPRNFQFQHERENKFGRYVYHMHADTHRGQKRESDPLELELQAVVSSHAGAENPTQNQQPYAPEPDFALVALAGEWMALISDHDLKSLEIFQW
ncbi:hypothetical protein STEG23_023772, partial [Scotinomys teguina]